MNCARDKFLASAAFAGDQHRRARIFQPRNHAQHVLNVRRSSDDSAQIVFGVHSLAQKFVFRHETNFLRHSLQQQPHFFDAEWLFDVVVRAQLHRIHGGFDRPMSRHDGNFCTWRKRFRLPQQLHTRLARQFQIRENQIRRFLFDSCDRGFRAFCFAAGVSQRSADGHAQFANALLIVHHQKPRFYRIAHGFPKVLSTTEISFSTRKGFSMHGIPLFASNAWVLLLAVSPLIKITLSRNSRRCARIHSCTSAPLMAPGMRMSEITPPKLAAVNRSTPSAPEATETTLYPCRSNAARTNAVTEGSSSIKRIVFSNPVVWSLIICLSACLFRVHCFASHWNT